MSPYRTDTRQEDDAASIEHESYKKIGSGYVYALKCDAPGWIRSRFMSKNAIWACECGRSFQLTCTGSLFDQWVEIRS